MIFSSLNSFKLGNIFKKVREPSTKHWGNGKIFWKSDIVCSPFTGAKIEVEIRRGFCRSLHLISTMTTQRRGFCSSLLTQTMSRWLFIISKEGDSTTSLGNLCKSFYPHSENLFLMLRWNHLCFSLYPLPLILSVDTTTKKLVPPSLNSWIFAYIDGISLGLLFSGLLSPSCCSLSTCIRYLASGISRNNA